MSVVLDVEGLTVEFETTAGRICAVDNLSFSIAAGETVALVGESGSGKTTAALSLLRLIPFPPGRIVAGRVLFEGKDLVKAGEAHIRAVRGQRIGVIFQDPMMALNPVFTVERQVGEVLRLSRGMSRREALAEVVELLHLVGVPAPAERALQYPHNLSGGMRQRVMIAMALACRPQLLIADEPTTALDVTIQAQVLRLLEDLKARLGMAVLLITHDLAVVAETAHRVVVMYAGQKVEEAPTRRIFREPRHPYTRGLLRATRRETREDGSLWEIAGTLPADASTLAGCRFASRCPIAGDLCVRETPQLAAAEDGGSVRCFAAEGRLA